MKVKVQKIGNSTMCTLPIAVVEYLNIEKGDNLDIRIDKNIGVTVNKINKKG